MFVANRISAAVGLEIVTGIDVYKVG